MRVVQSACMRILWSATSLTLYYRERLHLILYIRHGVDKNFIRRPMGYDINNIIFIAYLRGGRRELLLPGEHYDI